jgi:hypothetical protein
MLYSSIAHFCRYGTCISLYKQWVLVLLIHVKQIKDHETGGACCTNEEKIHALPWLEILGRNRWVDHGLNWRILKWILKR